MQCVTRTSEARSEHASMFLVMVTSTYSRWGEDKDVFPNSPQSKKCYQVVLWLIAQVGKPQTFALWREQWISQSDKAQEVWGNSSCHPVTNKYRVFWTQNWTLDLNGTISLGQKSNTLRAAQHADQHIKIKTSISLFQTCSNSLKRAQKAVR